MIPPFPRPGPREPATHESPVRNNGDPNHVRYYTEPTNLSHLLLYEGLRGWTRDKLPCLAGHVYEMGQVLSRVDGKYAPLDPAATDGTERAYAVLLDARVDATDADKKGVALARGGVVDRAYLVWPDSITETQKTDALESAGGPGHRGEDYPGPPITQ
uniref:Bacteriophage lambda head decoration protein D n=1 Tax=Candidatus Kentrum eta TaxID=2126337 RepID=A0A450VFW4_9GAMM|nr:MAG: Bacteriophage lambda head decoration protein D [Candidatus Kentron sp. H]VFK04032.1 MAG: Bacteriophage lambda head decoration protein D [Candidatus Kentron sp. H]VFK06570.1 MAG: Bacteriophage lambda head decoration protein D [Candidatus Kentron sp. H]